VPKLLVLASGVVKVPRGGIRAVSAYVVLSAGAKSRVFRVRGPAEAPAVEELPAATTLDVKRFQSELQHDLQPALDAVRAEGHAAHVELSRPESVIAHVRRHLEATEGLKVD
jgi:hypothetical protein